MIRKKNRYVKPRKLYIKTRIKEENVLLNKYGLKSKREIWKTAAKINYFRKRAMALAKSSKEEHAFLLSMQERFISLLKLPYRVVEVCTGDMTFGDARQFDVEIWIPSQKTYRETNSCSNTTDYQARGINARLRRKNGEIEFLHMLNATGIAIGRILIAIMENFQTKEGNIKVPEVLQPYVGKELIGNN